MPDYGRAHRRLRAAWHPLVVAGEVDCARCHLPILPGQPWDLGHADDDPTRYAGPEHRHARHCPAGGNRATLTHARAARAEAEAPPTIREW